MASIDQSSDIEVSEDEIEKVSSPETLSIWGLAWPSILANILFDKLDFPKYYFFSERVLPIKNILFFLY